MNLNLNMTKSIFDFLKKKFQFFGLIKHEMKKDFISSSS